MTAPLVGVRAITLDFGNTLVPVGRTDLQAVVRRAATRIAAAGDLPDVDGFLVAWGEEQARQFREEVPALREVDLEQRLVRVLARMRGMPAPAEDDRWDDGAARTRSTRAEIVAGVDAYSLAFVELIRPEPGTAGFLERLRVRGFRLAILSNWPLAVTIDRFAERAGWTPFLDAILVSQRIGAIKPSPVIFGVAADALRAAPGELLHVGDDWLQDIVGAKRAGWRAAYLRDSQGDTPLPTSVPGAEVEADLVVGSLGELEGLLA